MTAAPNRDDEPRAFVRGRPRDAGRDEALRDAALAVMADVGYRALTMDAVAARARAGKATIYRRWDSKLHLVIDAVVQSVNRSIPQPDTGSLSEDLRAFLMAFARFLTGSAGRAAQALVGELPHEPELADAFRRSFLTGQRDVLLRVLERAEERGELAGDAPKRMLVELAGAALTYRLMLTGDPLDAAFVDRLVDQVLMPLAGRPPR
ncbi:MAG TPA: TetR/AcrR family transcriptional regulator [Pseudonocardiaceae bacterium]|nr:TetR/AcrR family transcriptional regulator [Pseudonocardiaceae bacterium]